MLSELQGQNDQKYASCTAFLHQYFLKLLKEFFRASRNRVQEFIGLAPDQNNVWMLDLHIFIHIQTVKIIALFHLQTIYLECFYYLQKFQNKCFTHLTTTQTTIDL